MKWSPGQISGWLRRAYPDDPEMQVSHETIYLSLFVQSRGAAGRRSEDRAVPGRWEGDLLLGKRPTAIATLVERASRYTQLVALPEGHEAEPVRAALAQSIASLPRQLWRSLTWDQGKEMTEHARFTVDSGVQVYFCDPNSAGRPGPARGPRANFSHSSAEPSGNRWVVVRITRRVPSSLSGGLGAPTESSEVTGRRSARDSLPVCGRAPKARKRFSCQQPPVWRPDHPLYTPSRIRREGAGASHPSSA